MDDTDFWRHGGREKGPRSPPAGFAGSGPWGIGGVNPDPSFQLRGMDVGLEAGGVGKAGQDQTSSPRLNSPILAPPCSHLFGKPTPREEAARI